jgi:hypothetical protein
MMLAAAATLAPGASAQAGTAGSTSEVEIRVTYGAAESGFAITITGAAETAVKTQRDGRNLLLAFAGAAPSFDAIELQRAAAGWLEGVSVGHDAVLLRLAAGVDALVVQPGGGSLTLRLTRRAGSAPGDSSAQADNVTGLRRLELLRAQLLLRERQMPLARQRLEALRAAMPDSPEPVAGLAALEFEVGRWRRSLELYREADRMSGGDMALQSRIQMIERLRGGSVRINAERRRSRGGELTSPVTLDLVGLEVSHRIDEAWQWGIDADAADVDTAAVRRVDGVVQAFSGRRERAGAFARRDSLDGTVHTLSLFGGDSTGLGLLRRQVDDRGATSVVLEAHRSNWDYVEALIDRIWRDRLAVGRSQRLGANISARAEVGVNRYGLSGDGDVARSTSLAVEMRLDSLGGIDGLSAAYVLDAEYIGHLDARTTSTAVTYRPLPLLDREVHSATLGYTRASGSRNGQGMLTVDGQVGVGKDRYGRSGALGAVAVSWSRRAIATQVRASHTRNIGRARGTSESLSASVSIAF